MTNLQYMDLEFINTIIAVAALLISGFILIRDYLLRAKVKMFFGDSLQIIHTDRNKLQINFNFTNDRNKLSVINKLMGLLDSPNGNQYKYIWDVFYKLEGYSAKPDRLPTSISVLAKSATFQGVEFICDDRFTWIEGKYNFNITGWSNRGVSQSSNISAQIVFPLNKEDVDKLNDVSLQGSATTSLMRPVKIIN